MQWPLPISQPWLGDLTLQIIKFFREAHQHFHHHGTACCIASFFPPQLVAVVTAMQERREGLVREGSCNHQVSSGVG